MKKKRQWQNILKMTITIFAIAVTLAGCGWVRPQQSTADGNPKNYKSMSSAELKNQKSVTADSGSVTNPYCVELKGSCISWNAKDGKYERLNLIEFTQTDCLDLALTDTTKASGGGSFFYRMANLECQALFGKTVDKLSTNTKFKASNLYVEDTTENNICLDPVSITFGTSGKTLGGGAIAKRDGLVKTLDDYLKGDGEIGGNLLTDIINIIKAGVAGIFIIFFGINYIDSIVKGQFTIESMLKSIMQMMLCLVLILNAGEIASAFMNAGTDVITQIATKVNKSSTAVSITDFKGNVGSGLVISLGFNILKTGIGTLWINGGMLWTALLLLPPFICLILLDYKIVSQMLLRYVELSLRIAFAPIPLATSSGGFTPQSLNFLKGILACAIQPIVVLFAVASLNDFYSIFKLVFLGSAGESTTQLWATLFLTLTYLAASAIISQSSRMIKEVVER